MPRGSSWSLRGKGKSKKDFKILLKAYAFIFISKEGEPGAGEAPDPLLKPPPRPHRPGRGPTH